MALAANTTLKSLKFEGVSIGVAGYKALAANATLRSIKGIDWLRDNGCLNAFFKNKTLIHCCAWQQVECATNFKVRSRDIESRNKVLLKNQLDFQVFSSMLETNQLTFDLLWYVGSFLIPDSNFLKQAMETAKFIFPKSVLLKQDVLSINGKGGKRGIRVYPPWDATINRQAQKTQKWQREYFLDIPVNHQIDCGRVQMMFNAKP